VSFRTFVFSENDNVIIQLCISLKVLEIYIYIYKYGFAFLVLFNYAKSLRNNK
jgi:hypothetical protein